MADGDRFVGLGIPSLLFVDDVVLLASLNSDLKLALGWFTTKCETAGIIIYW